jgi:hypothetical protein
MRPVGDEGVDPYRIGVEPGLGKDRIDRREAEIGLRLRASGIVSSTAIPSWPEVNTHSAPAGTWVPWA